MDNSTYRTEIIFTPSPEEELDRIIAGNAGNKLFLATETTVEKLWLRNNVFFGKFSTVVIPAGEENKKLSSVETIWRFLSQHGADRKSLLINIGGGMLTDLAGFAASTFKRGIDFINVPTTLLSQVDASVGGKTGFNFNGLKNEIGTFREPLAVIIHTGFLKTLDQANLRSGFAEMVKHGLIFDPVHLARLEHFNLDDPDYRVLQEMIRQSVGIKKHFVVNDPLEKNIRKALNFGHTVGHAIESMAMESGHPVLHGFAVAWGMTAELFLSAEVCRFPQEETYRISQWIRKTYGKAPLNPGDSARLYELMGHDKKNEAGKIRFTLLTAPGHYEINQSCRREQVLAALDHLFTL